MNKENFTSAGALTSAIIGSTLLGVFLGSRSGGIYEFEIGNNLLTLLQLVSMIFALAFCGYFWLENKKISKEMKTK
ncbi:hypothetical protein CEE45_01485 [Candidatus Heimdallarchaeota archaeon B3_Heim]|nr:MAG: hypothetical protein CEE45_01485 [Candidatus Heimdallarchaeota archaeon B3_Heim]